MKKRQLKKLIRKVSYEVGFTGHGPILGMQSHLPALTSTEKRSAQNRKLEIERAL